MRKTLSKFAIKPIEVFLKTEAASGVVLAICALVAMLIANSPWTNDYFQILHFKVLNLSIQHWINDGLMVIFFFVIGMEIKKELLVGELSSPRKAALPIAGAIGGMMLPALVYLYFNPQAPNSHGWGIPMATDIAFALGVLTLFGKRVPLSLKVFLLALAIVDDLGAIFVIAIFYTKEIKFQGLGIAVAALGLIATLRIMGIRSYLFYVALGIVAWFGVLISGVHATVAGVILGLMTPLSFPTGKNSKLEYSPLDYLVRRLHLWVSFGIMPIFALANAGISFKGVELASLLGNPIHQGVLLGLLLGKPIGIFLFSELSVILKLASLPSGVNRKQVLGVGFLGGIGFTMALFISSLALISEQEVFSKTGIIFGSLLAGIIGSILLKITLPERAI